jgi:hypothetical protein
MWAMAEGEGGPGAEGIAGLDTSVAHPARVYDDWLGGTDNFAADREAAERVLAAAPGLRYRRTREPGRPRPGDQVPGRRGRPTAVPGH